jgi:hypothetical protein
LGCAYSQDYAGLLCVDGKCVEADVPCTYDDDACGAGYRCVNLDHHDCFPNDVGCECREWGEPGTFCPQDWLDSTPPFDNCQNPDYYCNAFYSVNRRGYCQKRALDGESCHAAVDSGLPVETIPCLDGSYCGEDYKCHRAAEAGEPCVALPEVAEPDGRCWREEKDYDSGSEMVCSACARGNACVDGICQRKSANYGESCEQLACGKGLNCVTAQVAGQCVIPP